MIPAPATPRPGRRLAFALLLGIALFSLLYPALSPYRADQVDWEAMNEAPSPAHPLGTDPLGRDVLTRLAQGGRYSLTVVVGAVLVDGLVGYTLGSWAGLRGGWVDAAVLRLAEALQILPPILLAAAIVAIAGPGPWSLIGALGLCGWGNTARIARSHALQIRQEDFWLAARALGAGTGHRLRLHLLPHSLGPLLAGLALSAPAALFGEAFLSFVGLGLPLPAASWGTMAREAVGLASLYPWQLAAPTAAIGLALWAAHALGEGLGR